MSSIKIDLQGRTHRRCLGCDEWSCTEDSPHYCPKCRTPWGEQSKPPLQMDKGQPGWKPLKLRDDV
jgi:hypothetical protein